MVLTTARDYKVLALLSSFFLSYFLLCQTFRWRHCGPCMASTFCSSITFLFFSILFLFFLFSSFSFSSFFPFLPFSFLFVSLFLFFHLFSRVHATLQPTLSVGRSVGRSVTLYFFYDFIILTSLRLPKWSGDLKYGPCPPARDFGSRVSGLVQSSVSPSV